MLSPRPCLRYFLKRFLERVRTVSSSTSYATCKDVGVVRRGFLELSEQPASRKCTRQTAPVYPKSHIRERFGRKRKARAQGFSRAEEKRALTGGNIAAPITPALHLLSLPCAS